MCGGRSIRLRRDEVWSRVSGIGKFAERGGEYFDQDVGASGRGSGKDPPKRRSKSRPVKIESAASPESIPLPDTAPELRVTTDEQTRQTPGDLC